MFLNLNLLKKSRDWIVEKANFVLGPWMRNPEESIRLFHALIGYSIMLSMGWISSSLIAKLLTWVALFAWTVLRSFNVSDVAHPIDAVKAKGPELAAYHVGAGIGFIVTSI